jgi:hypothetical protein
MASLGRPYHAHAGRLGRWTLAAPTSRMNPPRAHTLEAEAIPSTEQIQLVHERGLAIPMAWATLMAHLDRIPHAPS